MLWLYLLLCKKQFLSIYHFVHTIVSLMSNARHEIEEKKTNSSGKNNGRRSFTIVNKLWLSFLFSFAVLTCSTFRGITCWRNYDPSLVACRMPELLRDIVQWTIRRYAAERFEDPLFILLLMLLLHSITWEFFHGQNMHFLTDYSMSLFTY